ncbi:MAG: TM1812 family CRISPR-associated protein [Clostridiales bacterium]|nr:TM1812 family CRISPR-associated protein [Clostridiales bacterium]
MSKTKAFISTIPFQGKDKRTGEDMLKAVHYEPKGNTRLAYGSTRFPIIPVINGYAEKGDRIRVVAILTAGENYRHNYDEYFTKEVSELAAQNGYEFDGIEVITTPDSEDIETQLKLFADIIGIINDDEEVYACITYGTKPTPIVQFLALNYAYKLKKNVSIGCVAYGRFMHADPNNNNGLYDQTALFYMDSIVNKLADIKAPDPETAIRAMLGIGGY